MSTPLQVFERLGIAPGYNIDTHVVLSHDQRDRGRLRAETSEGREVRIFLERGAPLMIGEVLRSECGRHLSVEGACEELAVASCDDWATFSRACYHLGNRHVKVQIGELWLRMLPDHVLEEMLVQLGMRVAHDRNVFVPEAGAYGNGGHGH
ncbi:MAG TPA: urease accessory protein UreE [Pseudomonadales bacterium]